MSAGVPGNRNSRKARWVLRLLLSLLFLELFPACSLFAQSFSQYDVEAAYLYNFGNFVQFPASSSNTFDICILGHDPFGQTLDRLIANDRVAGRPVRKLVIKRPSQASGCAIVYIADSEKGSVHADLDALSAKGHLLVSGLPEFAEEGGVIQFVIEHSRVRFKVNLDAGTKNHLRLSSQLLKVAAVVLGHREGVEQ